MRKIAIAFVILLMLASGAVGVMKQMQIGPFTPDAEQQGESAASDEGSPTEPPRFVDVEPLVIPVFAGDKVLATIQLLVKLETTGEENEELLNRILPRLSDGFLRELYAYIPRLLRQEGPLNVTAVKARLQMVGDKIAGKGVIKDVLVQSVTDLSRG